MLENLRLSQTIAALTVATVLMFATTGQYAFADQLEDNLTGTATNIRLNPGGSQTVTYWISNQGPACDFSVSDPVTVTITGLPSGITATPPNLTFNACGTSSTNTQTITYQVSLLSPPLANKYSISFSSADPANDPLNTSPANIDIFVKPPAPTLNSPSNGATISDSTPNLVWNAIDSSRLPSSPAFTYEIEVDDNSGFGSPVASATGIASSITSYTVPSALTDGTYYWHVRVKQSDNTGDYSSAFSFILSSGPPPDTTAPVVTYTINGVFPPEPDGDNDWYTSDAFLDWTVAEPESPGSLVLTGCVDTLVNYDTAGDTFTCDAMSEGGSSGEQSVTIKRDASEPTVSHTVDPASPDGSNGWYVSDIDLSWTFGDSISGIDASQTVGCIDQILNTDFDTMTFSCEVTNNAGLSNSDSVDLKRDATKPEVISVTVSDTEISEADVGNTFTITVEFNEEMDQTVNPSTTFAPSVSTTMTATSAGSWTDGTHFTRDYTVADADVEVETSPDVTIQVSGGKDMAGNVQDSFNAQDAFIVDTKAPTVTGTPDRVPDSAAGWYNHAVTISWISPDDDDTCDSDSAYSGPDTDSSGTSIPGGSCTDNLGNVGTAADFDLKFDATQPNVALVGGPAEGGSYFFGFVPSAPTCNADDPTPGSGLAGPCEVTGYSDDVGQHTVEASAKDNADNTATDSTSYEVKGWILTGFYQPVDMSPNAPTEIVWNSLKGGQTAPLKFEIFADTEFTSTTFNSSPIGTFKTQKISCTTDPTPQEDPMELTTTGGTSFRYDTTSGQFVQNWQTTKSMAGSCFKATFTAQDGSGLTAFFKVK